MKDILRTAELALKTLLAQIPVIEIARVRLEQRIGDRRVDLAASVRTGGESYTLACEVLANGQPRYVDIGLLRAREHLSVGGLNIVPVLVAPYFSPSTREMCHRSGVGYIDLEGNARLAFGAVFIDRQLSDKPSVERRELKSLFRPKSAQVLRILLREPDRRWRVTALADAACVSLGHVSNVRTGLLDRQWAETDKDGLFLSNPSALLDSWRDSYSPEPGDRRSFYTTLHGTALVEAARGALGAADTRGSAAFASFSAAGWIAPYARTGTHYFYATEGGLGKLTSALNLEPASKGENIVVTIPKDEGVFIDTIEPAPGAICTGLVQTYLDLTLAGERGEEAARYLRQERMTW